MREKRTREASRTDYSWSGGHGHGRSRSLDNALSCEQQAEAAPQRSPRNSDGPDSGVRLGATTAEQQFRKLERELRMTNEILKLAPISSRRISTATTISER